jgi:hypothetical protein
MNGHNGDGFPKNAEGYAQRLYARVPAHYRAYDEEQGEPLLTLLRLVGAQVANLRQDLDDLRNNFFIETCDDWAVPYLAGLVGTNLLAHPVEQSNRLDVRHTVLWRRSKGTPAMLAALATAITGWPTALAEFFRILGWSQTVNGRCPGSAALEPPGARRRPLGTCGRLPPCIVSRSPQDRCRRVGRGSSGMGHARKTPDQEPGFFRAPVADLSPQRCYSRRRETRRPDCP